MIEAATVLLVVPVNELDHVMGPTSAMSTVELLTTVKAVVEEQVAKRLQ